ncbi:MAG: cobalamin B12-binding domain-containing protein [Lachnospiraceae bacterium]|jgi:corrinoid protein of di/trimethylamine methyltransferase
MEENTKKLCEAIMDGDEDDAAEYAQAIVDAGQDLAPVIEALTDTMRVLGDQFEAMEIFLPEMIMSADAMVGAMDIFSPVLEASGNNQKKGTIVLGTARGDMHDIGKNIVATVLLADGFDVVDLGKDVAEADYVNTAVEKEADIIGVSALMTTTMPGATAVIQMLKDRGLEGKFQIMVGGAPTSPQWAESIGANWSESASDAVKLANKLISK